MNPIIRTLDESVARLRQELGNTNVARLRTPAFVSLRELRDPILVQHYDLSQRLWSAIWDELNDLR